MLARLKLGKSDMVFAAEASGVTLTPYALALDELFALGREFIRYRPACARLRYNPEQAHSDSGLQSAGRFVQDS